MDKKKLKEGVKTAALGFAVLVLKGLSGGELRNTYQRCAWCGEKVPGPNIGWNFCKCGHRWYSKYG